VEIAGNMKINILGEYILSNIIINDHFYYQTHFKASQATEVVLPQIDIPILFKLSPEQHGLWQIQIF
jgi:hypothetical protein